MLGLIGVIVTETTLFVTDSEYIASLSWNIEVPKWHINKDWAFEPMR